MINIIIADHEPIFRAGAAKVLAVEDGLRIVGQPQYEAQLLNAIERLPAHVLLISTKFLPALLENQSQSLHSKPAVLVIAQDQDSAATFVAMGAHGIVYRSIDPVTLVQAVHRIAAGEAFIHAPNSDITEVHDDIVGTHVLGRLTGFELHVISMVMQSYRNREIAERSNTNEQTVKIALRSIFDKIGVSDRLELVLFVYHHCMLGHALQQIQINTNEIHGSPIKATATGPTAAPVLH